ncbi:ASCH domain-containing protein [Nocardioides cavernaquae]|uniref:ASCH domain-containing protein n=1 Tax=Nocardioides cavernaquae TaxID=2321396 RepID=A0A3A5H9V5_9ACTN|nr:ASCH domain-containing protein [Nocardioides cavernaquae]RJS47152.1 ASCH domain-containing protein [Nocardioides cavernaquae]
MAEDALNHFWNLAREHARLVDIPGYFGATPLGAVPPPAWSFGDSAELADRLLRLVLDGTKTATASLASDYAAEDEPLPEPGTLGIVIDGAGNPRALLATTEVRVVPFADVDAEHAWLEGEGDRALATWRADHARFFGCSADEAPGPDVVLERFAVIYQQ